MLVVARARLCNGELGAPLPMLVDVDAPGFERQQIPMALQAPDKQWTLFFDDVEVPEDRVIGGETGGLGALFDGLNPERIMGASIACGAGRRALELGAAYAASATSGGSRSAPTRGSRTRWPRPRSSSSWRG